MLRSLMILNNAGLVLFYKSWVPLAVLDEEVKRMGSVFRTIQEQSMQSTGHLPIYIQFNEVASSFLLNDEYKLLCVLIHDIEEGKELGGLLAGEILRSFISEFSDQDFSRVIEMEIFQSFHQNLPDAIHGVIQRILKNLKATRGIKGALFKAGENSENIICNLDNMDEIGVVANLLGVTAASSDLIQAKGDNIEWISLTLSIHIVFIHRFGDSSLVSLCRNNVSKHKYINAIENAVSLLAKVSELVWKLQG